MKRTEVRASDGVKLAVFEANAGAAETVLLVHGFPDDHTAWAGVAELLAAQHHVVAYDVRGSGASGRPTEVSAYRLEQLADDLARVAATVAPGKLVHLVGHDWGSPQGWEAVCASGATERFASFTSISGGSLDHLPGWVRTQLGSGADGRRAVASMWKSPFYMGAMQLPLLGDIACRMGLADAMVEWAGRFEIVPEFPRRLRLRVGRRPVGPMCDVDSTSTRLPR